MKEVEESLKDTDEFMKMDELRAKKNKASKEIRELLNELAKNILDLTSEEIELEKLKITEMKANLKKIELEFELADKAFQELVKAKMKEIAESEKK